MCALFGRELKGEPFGHLWAVASRLITSLLAILAGECVGTIAGGTAHNDKGEPLELELLLLPLSEQGTSTATRPYATWSFIGAYALQRRDGDLAGDQRLPRRAAGGDDLRLRQQTSGRAIVFQFDFSTMAWPLRL